MILFVVENAEKPAHVDKEIEKCRKFIDKYLRGARERKSLIKRLLGKLAFWKKAGKLLGKLNFLKKKREQNVQPNTQQMGINQEMEPMSQGQDQGHMQQQFQGQGQMQQFQGQGQRQQRFQGQGQTRQMIMN